MPDKLIWRDSINGIITVKSAYYEARRQLEFEEVDRSSRGRTWKIVWMAKVAPKVKNFIWRLIQQCLPVKAILREKGMQLETACVVCGNHEETIDHVFFSCLFSTAIWMKVFPGL